MTRGRMTGTEPSRRLLLVVGVIIVAVAVGCAVPVDSRPRAIDARNVPFDLLAPTSSTSSTVSPPVAVENAVVYLVKDNATLVPVNREVPSPPNARSVLRALFSGPNEADVGRGLSSAVTSGTTLKSVDGPINGLLTIDLTEDVLSVVGQRQIQALAQIVFTATELADVDRVLFEFEGRRRDVPRGDGRLTSEPLGRRDYLPIQAARP